jgi:predicted GNAT family acetyltransferase
MTAVEVHGLAQRVAAMGLKEFDDAGLPHVSLTPHRGLRVRNVGVHLRICVIVLDPLDVHHNLLPFCKLKREMTERLRSISVVKGDKAKVVAVLLVLTF